MDNSVTVHTDFPLPQSAVELNEIQAEVRKFAIQACVSGVTCRLMTYHGTGNTLMCACLH